jgi:hypothetical protein
MREGNETVYWETAINKLSLSAKAYNRGLKVDRTIPDLSCAETSVERGVIVHRSHSQGVLVFFPAKLRCADRLKLRHHRHRAGDGDKILREGDLEIAGLECFHQSGARPIAEEAAHNTAGDADQRAE